MIRSCPFRQLDQGAHRTLPGASCDETAWLFTTTGLRLVLVGADAVSPPEAGKPSIVLGVRRDLFSQPRCGKGHSGTCFAVLLIERSEGQWPELDTL